jgi:hypothetical protein
METVADIIAKFAKSQKEKLQNHLNIEASRRPKRKKPFELVRR